MVEFTLADTKLLLSEQISVRDLMNVARPFKKAIRNRRRSSPQEETVQSLLPEQPKAICVVDEGMARRVAEIVDEVAASVSPSKPTQRARLIPTGHEYARKKEASVVKKKPQTPQQLPRLPPQGQQPQLRLEELLSSGTALSSARAALTTEPISCGGVSPTAPTSSSPQKILHGGTRSRVELCRRRASPMKKVVPSPVKTVPTITIDEDDRLQLPSPHMLNSMMIMTIDGGRKGRGESDLNEMA